MTTMKIEIEAHHLLEILIDAGIPDNDAKSLVFDILSAQNGMTVAPRRREPEPEPVRVRQAVTKPAPQAPQAEPEEYEQDGEDYESEVEETPKIKTTRVSYQGNQPSGRNSQPINFSNFGGSYNGIGPKR